MSKGLIGAAGGLSAEDREKLIPENLREGVTLFEGTAKEVVGSFFSSPVIIAAWHYADRASQGGSSKIFDASLVSANIPGWGEIGTITILKDFVGRCYICNATFSGNGITVNHNSNNGMSISFKAGQTYNFETANAGNVAGAVTLIKAG